MIHVDAGEFVFATDDEAVGYLRAIVEHMIVAFGVSRDECIGRINRSWSHVLNVIGENAFMYRESPVYWANHFMYGKDSYWWIEPSDRDKLGLPPLQRLPFVQ